MKSLWATAPTTLTEANIPITLPGPVFTSVVGWVTAAGVATGVVGVGVGVTGVVGVIGVTGVVFFGGQGVLVTVFVGHGFFVVVVVVFVGQGFVVVGVLVLVVVVQAYAAPPNTIGMATMVAPITKLFSLRIINTSFRIRALINSTLMLGYTIH